MINLYFGIVNGSKKMIMLCGHETKLLSPDACRDILGLISLKNALIRGAVKCSY
jgi:hypothetical protein